MHRNFALAKLSRDLIHTRRPHSTTHQEDDGKIVVDLSCAHAAHTIERRIDGYSRDFDALRGRAPIHQLRPDAFVRNHIGVDFGFNPDWFRFVVGDHVYDWRLRNFQLPGNYGHLARRHLASNDNVRLELLNSLENSRTAQTESPPRRRAFVLVLKPRAVEVVPQRG